MLIFGMNDCKGLLDTYKCILVWYGTKCIHYKQNSPKIGQISFSSDPFLLNKTCHCTAQFSQMYTICNSKTAWEYSLQFETKYRVLCLFSIKWEHFKVPLPPMLKIIRKSHFNIITKFRSFKIRTFVQIKLLC